MSFLDRALRMGEAKKFKSYEQRVARINAFEPEMELHDDDELQTLEEQVSWLRRYAARFMSVTSTADPMGRRSGRSRRSGTPSTTSSVSGSF